MQSLTGASQSGEQRSGKWSRGPLQRWETTSCATPVPLHGKMLHSSFKTLFFLFFFRKVTMGDTWSSNRAAPVHDDSSQSWLRTATNPFWMDYTQLTEFLQPGPNISGVRTSAFLNARFFFVVYTQHQHYCSADYEVGVSVCGLAEFASASNRKPRISWCVP